MYHMQRIYFLVLCGLLFACSNSSTVQNKASKEPTTSAPAMTSAKTAPVNDPWLLVGDLLNGMKNVNKFGVALAAKNYVLSELDIETNTTTGSFFNRKSEPMEYSKLELSGFDQAEGTGKKGARILYTFGPSSSDQMKLHFGKIVKAVKTSGTKFTPPGKQMGTTFTIGKIYRIRIYDNQKEYEVELTQFAEASK